MAEESVKSLGEKLAGKIYNTILQNDQNKRVPPPLPVKDSYMWDTDYIVSGIMKTGNVEAIVTKIFERFKDGKVIIDAIVNREYTEEKETVLYCVFTTLNFSMTTESNWKETQLTVKGIAELSTKYHGKTLKTVVKRVADMTFFLFPPETIQEIAANLQDDSIVRKLNEDEGRSLDTYLNKMEIDYAKVRKKVGVNI